AHWHLAFAIFFAACGFEPIYYDMGVDLTGNVLTTDLAGADLASLDFSGADLPALTDFAGLDLAGVDFSGQPDFASPPDLAGSDLSPEPGWTDITPAFTLDLYGVGGKADDVFAVGHHGMILESTDHGSHWNQVTNPNGFTDMYAAFQLSNTIYLVGDGA